MFFLTKEAVRIALIDGAVGTAFEGLSSTIPDLMKRYAQRGRLNGGPDCFHSNISTPPRSCRV